MSNSTNPPLPPNTNPPYANPAYTDPQAAVRRFEAARVDMQQDHFSRWVPYSGAPPTFPPAPMAPGHSEHAHLPYQVSP